MIYQNKNYNLNMNEMRKILKIHGIPQEPHEWTVSQFVSIRALFDRAQDCKIEEMRMVEY